jgi:hypothetical protein
MKMIKKSDSKHFSVFSTKHQLLLYSLFIGLGSVSLYVFVTGFNTIYLGIVWKYTDSYIFNASIISLVALLASLIFFISCWFMIKKKPVYKYSGIVATIILIIFPYLFFLQGSSMPLSFEYLLLLSLPAVILFIFIILMWKKLD